jgi:hypothetical protein
MVAEIQFWRLAGTLLQFRRDKMRFLSDKGRMLRGFTGIIALFALTTPLRAAGVVPDDQRVVISVRDQKLMLLQDGGRVAVYRISTSKFGLGDNLGTMRTPLGLLQVAQKIGDSAPAGAVFHNRRWTGEILRPNAPGRDPIVTRIIWLRGLEPGNARAFHRCIYIHGTPEERTIGKPASYGCIRMRSRDVAALYDKLPLGAIVQIIPDKRPSAPTETPADDWITSATRAAGKPAAAPAKGASSKRLAGTGA